MYDSIAGRKSGVTVALVCPGFCVPEWHGLECGLLMGQGVLRREWDTGQSNWGCLLSPRTAFVWAVQLTNLSGAGLLQSR